MDHIRLFEKLRSRQTIDKAFTYALYDRVHSDYYYDVFEIDWVKRNGEEVINQLIISL